MDIEKKKQILKQVKDKLNTEINIKNKLILDLDKNKWLHKLYDSEYNKAKEMVIINQEVEVERECLLSYYREKTKENTIMYHKLMIKLLESS